MSVLQTISKRHYTRALLLVLALMGFGSCNNAAGNLLLDLNVADGVQLPEFTTIKIVVRSDDCQVRVFQTSKEETSLWLPTVVNPDQEFYLDVWACTPGGNFCQIDEIVGRGCTPIQKIPQDGEVALAIDLVPLNDPRYADCPPDPGGFVKDQGLACEEAQQ